MNFGTKSVRQEGFDDVCEYFSAETFALLHLYLEVLIIWREYRQLLFQVMPVDKLHPCVFGCVPFLLEGSSVKPCELLHDATILSTIPFKHMLKTLVLASSFLISFKHSQVNFVFVVPLTSLGQGGHRHETCELDGVNLVKQRAEQFVSE
jgi:hypothetical protein